jgi:hypothetical protein
MKIHQRFIATNLIFSHLLLLSVVTYAATGLCDYPLKTYKCSMSPTTLSVTDGAPITKIDIITSVPPNNTYIYALKINGLGDYVPWSSELCSTNTSFTSTPTSPNPLIISSSDRIIKVTAWFNTNWYIC